MFALTSAQRRYLIVDQVLPAAVINFLINLVAGWLFFHSRERVQLLQAIVIDIRPNSVALDLVPTTFFLVFFTGLVASWQTRRHVRMGRVQASDRRLALSAYFRPDRFGGSLRSATLLTLLLVPSTVLLLHGYHVQAMPLWHFIWFKAIYATLLALCVTPFIVLNALTRDGLGG